MNPSLTALFFVVTAAAVATTTMAAEDHYCGGSVSDGIKSACALLSSYYDCEGAGLCTETEESTASVLQRCSFNGKPCTVTCVAKPCSAFSDEKDHCESVGCLWSGPIDSSDDDSDDDEELGAAAIVGLVIAGVVVVAVLAAYFYKPRKGAETTGTKQEQFESAPEQAILKDHPDVQEETENTGNDNLDAL